MERGDIPAEAGSLIENVDTSGILRLNRGVLSNSDVVTDVVDNAGISVVRSGVATLPGGGTLMQNDYSITIPNPGVGNTPPRTYTFNLTPQNLTTIPETHMLFMGGVRLCETARGGVTRDYEINRSSITLSRTSRDFIGLDLILTVFTA